MGRRTIRQPGEPEIGWSADSNDEGHLWRGHGSLLREGRGAVATIRKDFRGLYWWGVTFKGWKPRKQDFRAPIPAESFGGSRESLAEAKDSAERLLRRGASR